MNEDWVLGSFDDFKRKEKIIIIRLWDVYGAGYYKRPGVRVPGISKVDDLRCKSHRFPVK